MKSPSKSFRSGFSLVELLVVITIISALATAMVPSLKGVLESYNVTGGADLVQSNVALARQVAMSRGVPVEVRLYKSDNGTGMNWRSMALVIPASLSGQTVDEWVTAAQSLPGGTILDDSGVFSTVLTAATPAPTSTAETWTGPWSGTEASTTVSSTLKGKTYASFIFYPNGSTNLPVTKGPWCLSVRSATSKPVGTLPAANFVSLVIDSQTGRTMAYRP